MRCILDLRKVAWQYSQQARSTSGCSLHVTAAVRHITTDLIWWDTARLHAERICLYDPISEKSVQRISNCTCRVYPDLVLFPDSTFRSVITGDCPFDPNVVRNRWVRCPSSMPRQSPRTILHLLYSKHLQTVFLELCLHRFGPERQNCCKSRQNSRCHSLSLGFGLIDCCSSDNSAF